MMVAEADDGPVQCGPLQSRQQRSLVFYWKELSHACGALLLRARFLNSVCCECACSLQASPESVGQQDLGGTVRLMWLVTMALY